MRIIEKEMLQAITERKYWNKSNMLVDIVCTNTKYGDRAEVFLFNNHIGDYWYETGKFETNIDTLLEWPSVTTISRLRALGVNVTQYKKRLYINDKLIGDKLKYDYMDGVYKESLL